MSIFISFEGGEGVGKSTQIKHLATALQGHGITAHTTREPGGTPLGAELHALLTQGTSDKYPPLAETFIFMADRVIHVEEVILPHLKQGTWILCDRYVDSTIAYQGSNSETTDKYVKEWHHNITNALYPHLTFLLDMPVETGLARAKARGGAGRFEDKGRAYHQEVRQRFLTLAKEETERFVVLNAEQDEDTLHQQIWQEVKTRFLRDQQ